MSMLFKKVSSDNLASRVSSWVVLMRSTTQDETIDAKLSVEEFFQQHGHEIKSWHADNGRYTEKTFKEAVTFANQTITFFE